MNNPLWHKPVRWFLERQLKKIAPSTPCKACGGVIPVPAQVTDDLWDMLVICPDCGHSRSLISLMNPQSEEPVLSQVSRLPEGSPVESLSTAEVKRWVIPGKRGVNFFYLFAIVWLAITMIVSSAFLLGENDNTGLGKVGMLAFFGLFYAVGIGALYTALCISFTKHELEVVGGTLRYRRRMIGRNKDLDWPVNSVQSVELKEFYQQNYRPVHGIEIRGEYGKIRFGSQLRLEEKQALVAQMRKALLSEAISPAAEPELNPEADVPASAVVQQVVKIDHRGRWHPVLMVGGIFGLLVTGFMLTQGLGMLRKLFGDDSPGMFNLVSGAFMIFWSAGPFVGVVLSSLALAAAWRLRHTDRSIEVNRSSVQFTQRTRTRTLVDTWDIHELHGADVVQMGTVNGVPKWRGEVHVGTRAIGFGSGRPKPELENSVAQIKALQPRGDRSGSAS